jgi:hypothetical protein
MSQMYWFSSFLTVQLSVPRLPSRFVAVTMANHLATYLNGHGNCPIP